MLCINVLKSPFFPNNFFFCICSLLTEDKFPNTVHVRMSNWQRLVFIWWHWFDVYGPRESDIVDCCDFYFVYWPWLKYVLQYKGATLPVNRCYVIKGITMTTHEHILGWLFVYIDGLIPRNDLKMGFYCILSNSLEYVCRWLYD